MENKIAIIDVDSVAYFIGHPNKILDENNNPLRTEDNSKFLYREKTQQELIDSAHYWMSKIFIEGKFTHFIGYIKGENTIVNRKEINESYKSNRKLEKPGWWDFVKNYLISEYNIIEANNYEVDDFVNSCKYLITNGHVVAIDKDLLSLESINSHYNWKLNQWIDISKKKENYNFAIDLVAGQFGDGVKGLKGKGIKFAEKLLNALPEEDFIPQILKQYIKEYGEFLGIKTFYMMYSSLKILTSIENMQLPGIQKVKF